MVSPFRIAEGQASADFRTTVDVDQYTRAIYVAEIAGATSYTVHNPVTGDDVTFYTGGTVIPVQTDESVTIAGHAVVYLY